MSDTSPTTRGYVDIRAVHPGFQRRECPCCGAAWWHRLAYVRGAYCPYCGGEPLLRRLAEEYAEDYDSYNENDYDIKPEPFHRYIPKAMAYEASEAFGWEVNDFRCLSFIDAALPEDHRRHKPVDTVLQPRSKRPLPDEIITGPDTSEVTPEQ